MVIASREELLLLILWRSTIALAVESGSNDVWMILTDLPGLIYPQKIVEDAGSLNSFLCHFWGHS